MGKLLKKSLSVILVCVMLLAVIPAFPTMSTPALAGSGGGVGHKGGYGSNGKFLVPIDPPIAGSIPISNRAGLEAIANNLAGNYHLTQNIDLSGAEWVPIGDSSGAFRGTLDGQGYEIRNLTIKGEDYRYNGLFFRLDQRAVIMNIGMENTKIELAVFETTSNVYAGSICGGFTNAGDGYISNCYNTGIVSIKSTPNSDSCIPYLGGISGDSQGTVSNSYNEGAVTVSGVFNNNIYAGGISGQITSRQVGLSASNCYNAGDVSVLSEESVSVYSGSAYIGGVFGAIFTFLSSNSFSIDECYNTGSVTVVAQRPHTGGLFGYSSASALSVVNSYNKGDIAAISPSYGKDVANSGGIGGYISRPSSGSTSIIDSYNIGAISSESILYQSNAGGILGSISDSTNSSATVSISGCINEGMVSADSTSRRARAGGILGTPSLLTTIIHCGNSGDVSASSYYSGTGGYDANAGGICGISYEPIQTCSNYGEITALNTYPSGYTGSSYAGGIFGYTGNVNASIADCTNGGNVSAVLTSGDSSGGYAGGICGATIAPISNCRNSGDISGATYSGGICGYGSWTSATIGIDNCNNTGKIDGNRYSGGIISYVFVSTGFSVYITNSINIGSVFGSLSAGGVIGYATGLNTSSIIFISNCFSKGTVSVLASSDSGSFLSAYAGGIFGYASNSASVEYCYNMGAVSTDSLVDKTSITLYSGGIGGYAGNSTSITNCYNRGDISADSVNEYTSLVLITGGICGYSNGKIDSCYNTGDVSGLYYIGGICGNTSSTSSASISNCFNVGDISGLDYIGGICGGSVTISNCYNTGGIYAFSTSYVAIGGICGRSAYDCAYSYWNIDSDQVVSGIPRSTAEKKGADAYENNTTSLTTEQMKQQSSFVGFDFDTDWEIVSGYAFPQLRGMPPVGGDGDGDEDPDTGEEITYPETIIYVGDSVSNMTMTGYLGDGLVKGEWSLAAGADSIIEVNIIDYDSGTLTGIQFVTVVGIAPGTTKIFCIDEDMTKHIFPITIKPALPLTLEEKPITFWSGRGGTNVTTTVLWGDLLFAEPATKYNHDLAIAAMALSTAAYDKDKALPAEDATYIIPALHNLGFRTYVFNDYCSLRAENDAPGNVIDAYVGVSISHRTINLPGNEQCNLIAVVIRGTQSAYGREWYSNFDVGTGAEHLGFSLAEQRVKTQLDEYLNDETRISNYDSTKDKILVTGHSRGAAVANLLAAELTDGNQFSSDNVYAYTFATPNVTVDSAARARDAGGEPMYYRNIHNFVNVEDFVPYMPLSRWGYWKYGNTYAFPTREVDSSYESKHDAMNDRFKLLTGGSSFGGSISGGKDHKAYSEGSGPVLKATDDIFNVANSPADIYVPKTIAPLLSLSPHGFFYVLSDVLYENVTATVAFADMAIATPYSPLSRFFIAYANGITSENFQYAHTPETYLAWLQATQRSDLTSNLLQRTSRGNLVRIACPVDIKVYNSLGVLVGEVTNNVANEALNTGTVYISVDGDVKNVYMPTYEKYKISMEGTDAGIMEYTVQSLDIVSADVMRTKQFANVALQNGKTFESTIEEMVEAGDVRLFVTDGGQFVGEVMEDGEEVTGVKIIGQIRSYNPQVATAITLYEFNSTAVVASTTIEAAATADEIATQVFTLSAVPPGTYDLVVTKNGQLSYTITDIVVGADNIDLSSDTTKSYSTITLLAGDVDGDGLVSTPDLTLLLNSFGKAPTSQYPYADISGDGIVSTPDLTILLNNFGKKNENCTVPF